MSWKLNPNVAYLYRGKTRKSATDVVAHRLGQVEAYLTVREVLYEASTAADGALSHECSGFDRCRYATLGLSWRHPEFPDGHYLGWGKALSKQRKNLLTLLNSNSKSLGLSQLRINMAAIVLCTQYNALIKRITERSSR